MLKKIFLLFFLLLLTACTSHIVDVTAISTRNINQNEVDLNTLPTVRHVVGEHTETATIFTFWKSPNLSKAVEDALNKGNGDLIINAQVTLKKVFIGIGFISTVKIEGDVVNTMAFEARR